MQKTRRFWIAALALLLTACLVFACMALSIPQVWALTGSDQTGEFGSVSVVGDYFRDVGRGDVLRDEDLFPESSLVGQSKYEVRAGIRDMAANAEAMYIVEHNGDMYYSMRDRYSENFTLTKTEMHNVVFVAAAEARDGQLGNGYYAVALDEDGALWSTGSGSNVSSLLNNLSNERGEWDIYGNCQELLPDEPDYVDPTTKFVAVEAAGNIEYWSCSVCGKFFADAQGDEPLETVTIAASGHKLTHHAEADATCEKAGNVEYWSCSECGKNFDASEANELVNVGTPVTEHVLIHHEATETTAEHWECSECGTLFADAAAASVLSEIPAVADEHAAEVAGLTAGGVAVAGLGVGLAVAVRRKRRIL